MILPQAHLILENNQVFTGESFGFKGETEGEVVFNTGMTGYENTLTDPSYRGQILVLTYPLIGNYGVPAEEKDEFKLLKFFESAKIHIRALIVSNYSFYANHWRNVKSLQNWLKENKIPALTGVDTRQITRMLRKHGTMLGKIKNTPSINTKTKFFDPNLANLVAEVSCTKREHYTVKNAQKIIILIDCGVKLNTIRHFLERKINVIKVPWDDDLQGLKYDGLMLSNGPGDPKLAKATIQTLQKVLNKSLPIFGICLGNQLLALAAGADTYKLKYGHRGVNQPCLNLETQKCYITSQNHGFTVKAKTLPKDWQVSWMNVNDQTVEGIKHKQKPFFSVQFHPEACPGPEDTTFLFDDFIAML